MRAAALRYASRLVALLLLPVLLLSLVGCHGGAKRQAFEEPEEFDTSRSYEITFWAKNDTNKVQTEVYKKAIEDFETYFPNIKVTLRLYTNYGDIYNDVITNIATNTTPNVCITYPDHIATYLSGQNVCVPLDDLLVDANYGLGGSKIPFDGVKLDEIVPEFLRECQIGEHYYALPYMRSTEACYVNKNLVEALGYTLPEVLTWDFIWEVSEKAMQKNADGTFAVNGQSVMIPFIYKSTDNMMIQLLRQLGAPYSQSNGAILMFGEETKAQLLEIAKHAETRAFSTFKISSYPGNFLNAGQCIFAVDSTAGATWMGSKAPLIDIAEDKLVDFETVVYPVPQVDPEHPQMISQGPSVCIFNKEDPQEVLASWLFTQFLLTNEVQISYATTEGYVPVTKKAQESEQYQDYLSKAGTDNEYYYDVKIAASKLLLSNLQNTFVTPVFNGSASLRDAAGQVIENVVKAKRRKQPVNDATLDAMFAEVISLYRLNMGVEPLVGEDTNEAPQLVTPGKEDLGPLPPTAIGLLATLVSVWCLLIFYAGYQYWKQKKKENC